MFSTVFKAIESKLGHKSGEVDDIKNDLDILCQRNKTLSQEFSATNQYMAHLKKLCEFEKHLQVVE